MQVKQIGIIKSPNADNRVRLTAKVTYDDKAFVPESYWFEVSGKYAEFLTKSGNPWLVCLLPLAVTLGEHLRISEPVDSQLFENAQELMRIWKCWHPHLHVISIDAEVVDTKRHECPERTAAFFSGGVDSFFTLLWHSDNNNSSKRFHINDLLCIWGFDVPLSNQKAFFQMRERLEKVAFSFDKELIDIATNLRDTRWQKTDWGYLSHGCALVSVALSLEKRFSKILIGSTGGYKDLNPWGSHIITDPLLSTSMTEIIHDGAFFNRVQKTEFVAKSEVALKSLRVCWKSRSDENCCACNKCYRTMITLELLGELDRCSTFNISKVDIGKVEKVYSPHYYDIEYYSEISSLAVSKGRLDISKAIDRSLKNSSRLNRLLKIIRSLQNKRFVWRFAQPLESTLLSHYIT